MELCFEVHCKTPTKAGTWHGGWSIPWRTFNRWNSWYFRVLTLQFLWMVQVSRFAIISGGRRDLWMLAWACR
jgi:hypothetical protein